VPRLLPVARRLLAVAGLVFAGWLLGTSGQASADTTGPAVAGAATHIATHTAAQAVAGLVQSLERPLPESEITGLPAQAVRAVVKTVKKDGAVREVRRPVRPMVHPQRPRERGVVSSETARKPVAAVAPQRHVSKVEGTHTVKNKRHVERAPMPVRQPYSPEAGSLLPQAGGGVVMGGWMAAPFRAGSSVVRRPVLVLAPWIGALPPVVRTAADEPSLSPD
jgi:hypothetical protein